MIYTREKLAIEKFFRYLCCGKEIFGNRYNRHSQMRVNGLDLQIDLIPEKACPGDCCYCPYGTTSKKTLDRERFFTVNDIIHNVTY